MFKMEWKMLRRYLRNHPPPEWMGDLFSAYYTHDKKCPCEIHFTCVEYNRKIDWSDIKHHIYSHPSPIWLGTLFSGDKNNHFSDCPCIQCEEDEYVYTEDEDDY